MQTARYICSRPIPRTTQQIHKYASVEVCFRDLIITLEDLLNDPVHSSSNSIIQSSANHPAIIPNDFTTFFVVVVVSSVVVPLGVVSSVERYVEKLLVCCSISKL